MKRRLIALMCVGIPMLITARLARPPLDPLPGNAHVGMVIPLLADVAAPLEAAFPSARVNVVFLSHNCGACRTVVADLATKRAVPMQGHVIVFLTDSTWAELDALAGPAVRIESRKPSYARAVGLHATPTLIELDRSKVVSAVAIGTSAVRSRFTVNQKLQPLTEQNYYGAR